MLARAKKLIGQSAIYGLGDLLGQGIRFFMIPLYTQFLTPADFAILSVTSTFGRILNIFLQFGLRGAVTRFHYDFLDDEQERRNYYGTIWIFLTLAALAATLIIDWQGEALFDLAFQDVPFHPYGRLALWTSYVTLASIVPLILFRVREQPTPYVLFTTGRFFFTTIGIVLFVAILRQGAAGSLRGQLMVGLIFAVPFTVITLRNLRLTFHPEKLKASFAFGLPMIPHQLSGWALSMSDRVLLTHYVSLDQLGLYDLGYRFGMILDLILLSVNRAWSPFVYRTAATEEDAPQTFARLTTYYAIAVLMLGLGVALLSKEVIVLIAKPAFHESYRVVPIVVLAFLFHGFYFMLVNQLFFTKQTKKLPLFTATAAITNIVLNLLTLSRFGIMAAACNTAVGYVVLLVLVFRESRRVYPVPYEYRRLAILFLTAGTVFLIGNLVELSNPYLGLMAKLPVIGLFPVTLFAFRFFTTREMRGMQLLLEGMKRRLLCTRML